MRLHVEGCNEVTEVDVAVGVEVPGEEGVNGHEVLKGHGLELVGGSKEGEGRASAYGERQRKLAEAEPKLTEKGAYGEDRRRNLREQWQRWDEKSAGALLDFLEKVELGGDGVEVPGVELGEDGGLDAEEAEKESFLGDELLGECHHCNELRWCHIFVGLGNCDRVGAMEETEEGGANGERFHAKKVRWWLLSRLRAEWS